MWESGLSPLVSRLLQKSPFQFLQLKKNKKYISHVWDTNTDLIHTLVFLVIKIPLQRFLEGFLVRLLVSLTKNPSRNRSLTKNPSRNRFNVILMGKKTRLMYSVSLVTLVPIQSHLSVRSVRTPISRLFHQWGN